MPEPIDARSSLASTQPSRPGRARVLSFEMDDNSEEGAGRAESASPVEEHEIASIGAKGFAKHTIGLLLLGCVVFLWTVCNFLGSSIFADNTYAKPFFLTYLNTSAFVLAMVPSLTSSAWDLHKRNEWRAQLAWIRDRYRRGGWRLVLAEDENDEKDSSEGEGLMASTDQGEGEDEDDDIRISHSALPGPQRRPVSQRKHLAFFPTALLSLKFCILWFLANYFAMACLQHTSVASATILTSTSSIWTLFVGALTGIEKFTLRKFLGVTASLFGIVLISHVDLGFDGRDINYAGDPTNPTISVPQGTRTADVLSRSGSFPEKSIHEIIVGDGLALLSAALYGLYTIMLKKVCTQSLPLQLNMPLFFGLVGAFNFLLLWPFLPILSVTGVEPFQLPPTPRIWMILLINTVASLTSEICWACAMLLTSPLVVTVGLSLTIPLSLIGEMIIQGRFESVVYWIGSLFVVGSFIFVDNEETKDGPAMEAEQAMRRHRERYGDDHRTKWDRFKDFITYRGT